MNRNFCSRSMPRRHLEVELFSHANAATTGNSDDSGESLSGYQGSSPRAAELAERGASYAELSQCGANRCEPVRMLNLRSTPGQRALLNADSMPPSSRHAPVECGPTLRGSNMAVSGRHTARQTTRAGFDLNEVTRRLLEHANGQDTPLIARADLRAVLLHASESQLDSLTARLVETGVLVRVRPGLFINATMDAEPLRGLSCLVAALRPHSLCYLSFESALSYWGSIDQVPMASTFMTSGASGTYETPWRNIEMRHTERSRAEIVERTGWLDDEELMIASPDLAAEDCTRCRRPTVSLIRPEHHALAIDEWREHWAGNGNRGAPGG